MNSRFGFLAIASFLAFSILSASQVQASLMFTVNIQAGSDPLVTNVLVEQSGNNLMFTLTVDDSTTGNIGDLRGLFFDVDDESLLSGLLATGADVTDQQYSANNVNDLGNGANINGSIGKNFDAGIEIGTQGIGGDDIQMTSFVLSHNSVALNLNNFFRVSAGGTDYMMAVRATSVGPAGGDRNGSSKTGVMEPNPEPATALIWGAGCLALALGFRRRVA